MDKYRKIRQVVLARSGNCCERCGTRLRGDPGVDYSVHHRRPRGMGGSKRPSVTSAVNLVALCGSGTTGCHGQIESDRETAYESGWLVRQGADPALIPVPIFGRPGLTYLTDDGGYRDFAASPQDDPQAVDGR